MQISFTHSEIREALVEYLEKQITLAPGQTVSLEFDLDDPTDIIAYVDVLREGQKAKGMPPKPDTCKASGTSEPAAQAAPRKTRGPNKPKTAEAPFTSPGGLGSEEVPIPEPTEVAKVNPPFPGPFVNKTVLVQGAAAPIQSVTVEASEADPVVDSEPTIQEAPEEVVEAVTEVEAIKTGNSIFPNAGSSAAAPVVQAAAPASPKSLFANLTRPSNAQTAH